MKHMIYLVVLATVVLWWGILAFTHLDFTPQMLLVAYWRDYLIGMVAVVGFYYVLFGEKGQ